MDSDLTTRKPSLPPRFTLAWMLKKNGLSVKDVKVVNLEPQAAANAMIADAYFDAVDTIKAEPKKSFEIMGADVKQSAEAFEKSQAYLRWQDRAANQKFFAGEHAAFTKEAADLLLEAGIIKQIPDLSKLADTRFIK